MRPLILKNGNVYDPQTKENRKRDLGIRDGRIVPVEMISMETAEVVDAEGCLVTPGFIDYHIHLYTGCDGGVKADLIAPPSGVTTVVDGGSCGVSTFEMFKRNDIDSSVTRVLSYLHVSSGGLVSAAYPENMDPRCFEKEKIIRFFKKYPDILTALKFRISRSIIGPTGLTREPLEKTIEIAEEIGCPVVVHINDPIISQEELAEMLRPGDVFCHMYQGQGDTILDENQHVKKGILRAKERGVIFDASNGKGNFAFRVAAPAIEEGFLPDIISSDLSPITLYQQPAVSLPRLISKYLAFGIKLEAVIDMVTINPARQLQREELASLKEGTVADITISKLVYEPMKYFDARQEFISGDCALVPVMTVKGGEVVYCQTDFNGLPVVGRML